MKDATLTMVSEFHRAFDVPEETETLVNPPTKVVSALGELASMQREVAQWAHDLAKVNNGDRYLLRVQLMAEELAEVIEAMCDRSEVQVLHELADLRVVCDGTALQLGLGDLLVPAVAEIHRANMSKLGRDGKPIKNAAGRVMKGPDFRKADVSFLLRRKEG